MKMYGGVSDVGDVQRLVSDIGIPIDTEHARQGSNSMMPYTGSINMHNSQHTDGKRVFHVGGPNSSALGSQGKLYGSTVLPNNDNSQINKSNADKTTSKEQVTVNPDDEMNEEEEKDLTKFQKARRGCKRKWEKFLFKPKDPFKIKWDIFVILLSIWNAIQIPMGFAFPLAFEGKAGYIYSDYIIDFCFIFDIIINFRSCYVDSRTDELVEEPKKITANYLKGRFWVDLVASCNFDLIFMILFPDMGDSALTSLFGMLKLVRLLRLGRMVTYLSKSKSAKLGAMMIQLFFMLLLLLHWMACVWFILAAVDSKWIPSKDLDWDETIVFSAAEENSDKGYFESYVILFYYACLALLGNDYVPTNPLEILLACVLVLVGAVSIGVIIGQFAQLLSDADKAKRRKNEQYDRLTTKMTNLHVPEQIYARVTEYYDEKMKIKFVSDRSMYKYFNKSIKVQFCAHQMKKPIEKFMKNLSEKLCKITKTKVEIGHTRLINSMSTVAQTAFYLPDQTIIRQDALPDGFYFIIEGDCLVFQESEGDFKDYDYFEEKRILQDPEGDAENEDDNTPMKSGYGDDSFGSPYSPQRRRLTRSNTIEDQG